MYVNENYKNNILVVNKGSKREKERQTLDGPAKHHLDTCIYIKINKCISQFEKQRIKYI